MTEHPRNREFFDDIYGAKWDDLKQSITRRGVIEPIIITQDLMIVSGHQRVNACKALRITEIPFKINEYPEVDPQTGNLKEDLILEDLICTNIMQRGSGNLNPIKMGKCIVEMERIYGIKVGGDRKSERQNVVLKTQSGLSETMGLSVDKLQRFKQLTKLIPDIQILVERKKLKPSIAYSIISKLNEDEQQLLLNELQKGQTNTKEEIMKIVESNRTANLPNKNSITNGFSNEKELENELIHNLHLIEDGMTYISNQIDINGGIIDILAKDTQGNTCIIELKVKPDDERIVFQSLLYPKKFKQISNENINDNVRMMTICPDYSHNIHSVLKDIDSVEMYKYKVKNNKLMIHRVA